MTVVEDVNYDAGMQIQGPGRDDDDQERTSQQSFVGTNDPSGNLNLPQGEDAKPNKVINFSTPAGPADAGGGSTYPLCAYANKPQLARQDGCVDATSRKSSLSANMVS